MNRVREFNTIRDLYVAKDILARLFPSDIMNFGFWPEQNKLKSQAEEVDPQGSAAAQLYREVGRELELSSSDEVLEIGAGRGAGAVALLSEYKVKSYCGVDRYADHVAMASARLANVKAARVQTGLAERLPFGDGSFDKIFSIEAFQHFQVRRTMAEAARVLRPGGVLVVATLLPCRMGLADAVAWLLPTVAVYPPEGDFEDISHDRFLDLIRAVGMDNVTSRSIGSCVWPGWHEWVCKVAADTWNTQWLAAYQQGLIDYYVVQARRRVIASER